MMAPPPLSPFKVLVATSEMVTFTLKAVTPVLAMVTWTAKAVVF
ncbi:MAG: hypothetical protein OXU31_03470 [Gammaproteobacteria bacterium]|nr:hypothetical protein [Gammaproteobacteria bacterium]MDD9815029.1 hypothetical protein [Gammaproteobacteria bacterium]